MLLRREMRSLLIIASCVIGASATAQDYPWGGPEVFVHEDACLVLRMKNHPSGKTGVRAIVFNTEYGDVLVRHTVTNNDSPVIGLNCCADTVEILDWPPELIPEATFLTVQESGEGNINFMCWKGM